MYPVTASSVNGGNFNRYWYANNNPYKFNDPDGRLACLPGSGQNSLNGSSHNPCIVPPPNPWGGGNPTPSWEEGPSHSTQSPENTPAFFDGEHVSEETNEEFNSRKPDLARQQNAIVRANAKLVIRTVLLVDITPTNVATAAMSGTLYAAGKANDSNMAALGERAKRRGWYYDAELKRRNTLSVTRQTHARIGPMLKVFGLLGMFLSIPMDLATYGSDLSAELEEGAR